MTLTCISELFLAGTCQILNGGCEEICIPVAYGRRCECDIGLQLQDDYTCDGSMFYFCLTVNVFLPLQYYKLVGFS